MKIVKTKSHLYIVIDDKERVCEFNSKVGFLTMHSLVKEAIECGNRMCVNNMKISSVSKEYQEILQFESFNDFEKEFPEYFI